MSNLLKSKFLLGAMIVAVMVVGAFALTTTVKAADCDLGSVTLRQGSTGEAVECLQSKIGATVDGKFGPMTKAKVMAFQTDHSLVADGVVGALTRAALAGITTGTGCGATGVLFDPTTGAACTVSTVPGCVAGALYSSTTGAACTVSTTLPAGCTSTAGFSPTTGVSCATGVVISPNGEGSLTVTYDPVPANNLAIKMGEEKAAFALKLKATGSDMKVSRVWLDINTRIWLSADKMSILDGSTVLAEIPLSASTVEEVTAGSAYQIQFNGLNVTVPKDTTKVLTVNVHRPSLTSAHASSTVAATSAVRAVDMSGISATYVFPSTRVINLTSSTAATVGTLTATLSTTSPTTQSVSGLSATAGVLTAVKLMDVSLKATDGPAKITALSGTITATGCTSAECLSSVELRDGTNVLDSVTGADTFAFADFGDIDVAADSTKTLSVWAQVNPISATLVAGESVHAVVDSITATTGDDFTAIADSFSVTGNEQYFYQYAPTITLGATTATASNSSGSISADYSISFTVAAPSGHDIYVHQTVSATAGDSNMVVEKTVAGNGGTIAASTPMTASVLASGTDGATYFLVPAGLTRTFTAYAHVPVGGVAGYTGINIHKIYWALADAGTGAQAQTWGLGDFHSSSVYVTAS